MTKSENIEFEAEIESFAQGGRGFTRRDGKAVFVRGALPGERVIARISKIHKSFDEAVAVRILSAASVAGPDSASAQHAYRTAPCPHAGDCGGCDWTRLEESAQLAWKATLVEQELRRIFGAALDGRLQPPVASPLAQGYRCRITLKIADGALGYFAEGTHDLVSIDNCMVATGAIRQALAQLRPHADRLYRTGYREVELRAAPEDDAAVGVFRGPQTAAPPEMAGLRGATFGMEGRGDVMLRYQVADCQMEAGPRSFVQVNLGVNELLVNEVLALMNDQGAVVDAYGGNANFGVPLAKAGHSVLGLEGSRWAVADARANIRNNQVDAQWLQADEQEMIAAWRHSKFKLDAAVLLDPPRAGARNFLAGWEKARIRPARVIYVSCEPSTLQRDLRSLQTAGYELAQARVFDMFPQTHHVETVVALDRK
jgi:23S rRNA (uracil1939-C5)-methyltransferase